MRASERGSESGGCVILTCPLLTQQHNRFYWECFLRVVSSKLNAEHSERPSPFPDASAMTSGGWGLLLLWSLGWGLQASDVISFVPSPDAIWSFACLALIGCYRWYSRLLSGRVARGDAEAVRTSLLPVYGVLVGDAAIGLGILCVLSTTVMFAANFQFSGTLYVLAVLNVARWFCFELIVEGVGFFFLQRTLGRQALVLALIPASVWASTYTVVNVSLLAVFFNSGSSIPRFTLAGINIAIAAAYGLGPLGLNYGRPALRPYAWFNVIQRCVVAWGLVMSTLQDSQFPVLLFDLLLLLLQVRIALFH